jgi:hypothetical protein
MLIGDMMRGMMRGLVQNDKLAGSKSIELLPGQVVKATVLQTFSNQEALLNIDGVKIRATLETPLKAGQVATLQVQNDSTATQIILKPLQVQAEVAEEAVKSLLQNIAAKDTPANRMLAQQLLTSPVPVTKEAIQQIRQVMEARPANIAQDEWNQAIVVAHNKGLPMSEDSIRALHQVLFGTPLHESIEQLSRQLTDLSSRGTNTPQAQQKIEQLMQILQQLKALSAQITGKDSVTTDATVTNRQVANPTATNVAQMSSNPREVTEKGSTPTGPQQANQAISNQMPAAGTTSSRISPAEVNIQPNTMQTSLNPNQSNVNSNGTMNANVARNANSNPTVSARGQELISNTPVNTNSTTGVSNTMPINDLIPSKAQNPVNGQVSNTSSTNIVTNQTTQQAPTLRTGEITGPIANNWAPLTTNNYVSAGTYSIQTNNGTGERQIVQQMLQQMGVHTESGLAQAARQTDAEVAVRQAQQTAQMLTNQIAEQISSTTTAKASTTTNPLDSLKGTLMQLMSMTELPAAVKSTLESLTQHITGQQLLLTPDKYGSFSYVTMTIPLFDQQQEGQTAEVFIQSRKNKKGRLDPQNCRLLFDLNMQSMGQTMVDVQVVDRIVNVYIMNDHPEVQAYIEDSRDEIASSMESIGYQFLSLKVSDYPERIQALDGALESEVQAVKLPQPSGQNYRGVDYRV